MRVARLLIKIIAGLLASFALVSLVLVFFKPSGGSPSVPNVVPNEPEPEVFEACTEGYIYPDMEFRAGPYLSSVGVDYVSVQFDAHLYNSDIESGFYTADSLCYYIGGSTYVEGESAHGVFPFAFVLPGFYRSDDDSAPFRVSSWRDNSDDSPSLRYLVEIYPTYYSGDNLSGLLLDELHSAGYVSGVATYTLERKARNVIEVVIVPTSDFYDSINDIYDIFVFKWDYIPEACFSVIGVYPVDVNDPMVAPAFYGAGSAVDDYFTVRALNFFDDEYGGIQYDGADTVVISLGFELLLDYRYTYLSPDTTFYKPVGVGLFYTPLQRHSGDPHEPATVQPNYLWDVNPLPGQGPEDCIQSLGYIELDNEGSTFFSVSFDRWSIPAEYFFGRKGFIEIQVYVEPYGEELILSPEGINHYHYDYSGNDFYIDHNSYTPRADFCFLYREVEILGTPLWSYYFYCFDTILDIGFGFEGINRDPEAGLTDYWFDHRDQLAVYADFEVSGDAVSGTITQYFVDFSAGFGWFCSPDLSGTSHTGEGITFVECTTYMGPTV